MLTMTRTSESTAQQPCLLLALELARRTWKLRFTVGSGNARDAGKFQPEPLGRWRTKSFGRRFG